MRLLIKGIEAVIQRFQKLEGRMQNKRDMLETIGHLVVGSVQKNFEAEGRPNKWKRLSQATLRARRNKNRTKILQDTGRLKFSINFKVFTNSVAIGTDVEYAAIHQFGGKAGRGHKVFIPARPYLMLQEEDKKNIREIIRDYLGVSR